MAEDYRNNHYVPQWYQKRFLPAAQKDQELFYLDLKPGEFVDPRGIVHQKKNVKRQGFKFCFVQKDLYTSRVGEVESKAIEKDFFGEIDRNGHAAVNYFTDFDHTSADGDAFNSMMMYMSTQKLRTPKGLGHIADQEKTGDHGKILSKMLNLRQLHCAIWTECIWQIADAKHSETKFIVSDHPVTVYNRRCGPRSQWCRGNNDPDIWFQATHTIFPLSLEKILILTNLSWVRNPYQSEVGIRPNPSPLRDAIFNFQEIQIHRHLCEQEVREINFIVKSRALRFVAAAKEAWLYPEQFVSKSEWNLYGDGYLFMPDPRAVYLGGEIFWRNRDGSSGAMDAYGRRRWDRDFGKESSRQTEAKTLFKFQGEFARLYGPNRRGRSFHGTALDPERDDDKFHEYHLNLDRKMHNK
jgi:hypothetical protein